MNVDYSQLEKLLAQQNWRDADVETAKKMCEVMKKANQGWLTKQDIQSFPCKDLLTIDRLWVNYSQGKFGFSVQKRIYQQLGGTSTYDAQVWNNFIHSVGWFIDHEFIPHFQLKFTLDAPIGNLPIRGGMEAFEWRCLRYGAGITLFSRLETCNLYIA